MSEEKATNVVTTSVEVVKMISKNMYKVRPSELGVLKTYNDLPSEDAKELWVESIINSEVKLEGLLKNNYCIELEEIESTREIDKEYLKKKLDRYRYKVLEEGVLEILKEKREKGGYVQGGGKVEELQVLKVNDKESALEYIEKLLECIEYYFKGNYIKFRVMYDYKGVNKRGDNNKEEYSVLNRDVKEALKQIGVKDFKEKYIKELRVEDIREREEWWESLYREGVEYKRGNILEELITGLLVETVKTLEEQGVLKVKRGNWLKRIIRRVM